MLITVPAAADVELIVQRARSLNPGLHIVARAQHLAQMEALRAMGVNELVQPESEAGLEIVRQALTHFDIPAVQIQLLTDSVRRELYQPLHALRTDARLLERLTVALTGWPRFGYGRQHPDVRPPAPEAGGWEGMKRLAETCAQLGYLFSLHERAN